MKLEVFQITDTIFNQAYNFAKLYGQVSAHDSNNHWYKKLAEVVRIQSGFAAVSINKNLAKEVDYLQSSFNLDTFLQQSELTEFTQYTTLLGEVSKLFQNPSNLTLELIDQIHSRLLNLKTPMHYRFRNRVRILPKYVWENGIFKTIKLEVKTRPEDILNKLTEFLDWLSISFDNTNPIILAGICHYKLVEIHPYDDANGRLSRIFERGILYMKGIDTLGCISLEDFFLKNRERYYDLIEDTQKNDDLTNWLEFYTEGLLYSITESIKLLNRISGGTIDIFSNKHEKLTNREEHVVNIIRDQGQASGAEIAKMLNVSRQNINVILKKLHARGLLTKIGSSTSSRYKLAG